MGEDLKAPRVGGGEERPAVDCSCGRIGRGDTEGEKEEKNRGVLQVTWQVQVE